MEHAIPPAEVEITIPIVREVVDSQFPQFSDDHLQFLDEGWDNINYRLGDDYIVRIPRRQVAVPLLEKELHFLPLLSEALQIKIPCPVYAGKKTNTIPWCWSIVPWFDGKTANLDPAHSSEANRLAVFLKNLHNLDFPDFPVNPHRSLSLSDKREAVDIRLENIAALSELVSDRIIKQLDLGCKESLVKPCPIHADLHTRNIIQEEGYIKAIIDWGDMCLGDPATDLLIFWMLFKDQKIRAKALQAYGAKKGDIIRSKAWAVVFASILVDTGRHGHTQHLKMGQDLFTVLDACTL